LAEARTKSGRCIFRLQNRLDQIETAFFARERLPVDQAFAGPAIILQSDSTTVVPPGHSVVVEPSGNMIIRIGGQA
jgi:N-methylhydantoinase A